MDMAGKYVIKNITIASIAKKGKIAFAIVSTFSPDTDDATNKTSPIGGVANPTVKLTDIIIAKCTGCTPSSTKTGPRIGPKIIIAGPASRNIPTINKSILIKNNSTYGLLLKLNTNSARYSGAWDKLTTVLNAIAAPTNSRTTDDVKAASVRTFGRSRIVIDLRIKMLIIKA